MVMTKMILTDNGYSRINETSAYNNAMLAVADITSNTALNEVVINTQERANLILLYDQKIIV